MTYRRTVDERRRARAAGVDRYGRPLPRRLRESFDPAVLRCYRCGRKYSARAGNLRELATRDSAGRRRPYAYRCFDQAACRERERRTGTVGLTTSRPGAQPPDTQQISHRAAAVTDRREGNPGAARVDGG